MYLYEKASNLDNLCKLGHISDRKKRQKRATFWSFTAFTWGIYKVFLCWHVESSILKHTVLCDKIYKWNLWFICTQNGRNCPRLRNLEISHNWIKKTKRGFKRYLKPLWFKLWTDSLALILWKIEAKTQKCHFCFLRKMSNKINFEIKCLAIFLLTSRKIELQCWDKNAKKENEKSFKNHS